MALVLSLKAGEDFYVEDVRFLVTEVLPGAGFRIRREGTGRTFEVDADSATEILDDVFVSSGDRNNRAAASVAIDAPRSRRILRGEKYRSTPGNPGNQRRKSR